MRKRYLKNQVRIEARSDETRPKLCNICTTLAFAAVFGLLGVGTRLKEF